MGLDDRNEGGAGECPGHEWVVASIQFDFTGGRMSEKCKWCGAVAYRPSARD